MSEENKIQIKKVIHMNLETKPKIVLKPIQKEPQVKKMIQKFEKYIKHNKQEKLKNTIINRI